MHSILQLAFFIQHRVLKIQTGRYRLLWFILMNILYHRMWKYNALVYQILRLYVNSVLSKTMLHWASFLLQLCVSFWVNTYKYNCWVVQKSNADNNWILKWFVKWLYQLSSDGYMMVYCFVFFSLLVLSSNLSVLEDLQPLFALKFLDGWCIHMLKSKTIF